MNRRKNEALAPFIDDLKRAYATALPRAGHTREWPYGYVSAVIACYRELRRIRIRGQRLTRALGRTKETILLNLVKRTSDRDNKARSRWCSVAWLAIVDKIEDEAVMAWIRDGGGLAGRARQAADRRKRLATR